MCSWLTGVGWTKWNSGRQIWDAAKSEVHTPHPIKTPLPSDSRYRGDLKALLVSPANLCCCVMSFYCRLSCMEVK